MVLRVDSFHESHRLLLYSPFWILNRTGLKLEFQVGKANKQTVFLNGLIFDLFRLKIIKH